MKETLTQETPNPSETPVFQKSNELELKVKKIGVLFGQLVSYMGNDVSSVDYVGVEPFSKWSE